MIRSKPLNGDYILEEVKGFSRDEAVIASGKLDSGTVLGQITASGEWVQLDPSASDGSQTAKGILMFRADASTEKKRRTITSRLTIVRDNCLIWPESITPAKKKSAISALETAHIIVR